MRRNELPDPAILRPENAALVLIDAQPNFFEKMAASQEPVLTRIEHLLLLAGEFELPCIATFEHPVEEKGWLPDRLERVMPPAAGRYVKHTYDLTREPEIRSAIRGMGRSQLIVAGSETDVCVLQSVLGLCSHGYQVFLVEDCLFTAEPNVGPSLRRMEGAGAIPMTYKMLYYELKETVDIPPYHEGWNTRHLRDGHGYVGPYELPDLENN
jgi:nicotinamidase-related amidase